MREALVVIVTAARPRGDGTSGLIEVVLVAGVIALIVVGTFVSIYFKDRRAHEGVNLFKRRRVLRSGVAADATVLSSSRLERDTGIMETAFYSNVYEVRGPDGASFRARGIEEMPTAFGMAGVGNIDMHAGETLAVKYDAVDHTIVMVNPYVKKLEADQRAAQYDQAREAERRAERLAQQEKEAQLLRGEPPS